jgi:hypothetical protein
MKKTSMLWHHIFIIPSVAAFIAVFGCIVMVLWNALLPGITGLRVINFPEAAGILILARILFGGLGGMGWHQGHKNPFKEKWLTMSDEERKAFITKYHGVHHHGFGAEAGGQSGPDSDKQKTE